MSRLEIFVVFAANHPYLICNLLGLIPLSVLYIVFPKQRSNILISGLIWIPLAPMAVVHEDYWNPVRLWNLRWGIEDALYLFNVNALSWAFAAGLVSRRFRVHVPVLIDWRRLVEFVCLGIVLAFFLFRSELSGMTIQVILNVCIALWLFIRCKSYWPLALAGVLFLPAISLIELKIWFAFWPGFVESWHPERPWGRLIAGIPLGEIAFYLTYSILAPISVAFCRGATLLPRDRNIKAQSFGRTMPS